MRIVVVRRIFQGFFLLLFLWFAFVLTLGERFYQLRGWPVNIFLELDPLVAIGTVLSTHTLYKGLLWAVLTIFVTIVFGRFFCSWVCPFGTLHHVISYFAHRKKKKKELIELNRYRKTQWIKYAILVIFLTMAALPLGQGTLLTGLLDPIPLMSRSVNLALLPIADNQSLLTSQQGRFYEGAWLILLVFIAALLLNFIIPRFYCRFVCPLGALLGIMSRFAIWRIGRNHNHCSGCHECQYDCVGGCEPEKTIHINECLLCFNCRDNCSRTAISYQTSTSIAGENLSTGMNRRSFLISMGSTVLFVPALRLAATTMRNWYAKIVRPPGAINEVDFLKRCIKCGQCMRICPTNVIQPAELQNGIENIWTPRMNFRIGSSGCQHNCVACSQICPTAAIRPISLDEKHGKGEFAKAGMIRIGTAFIDRGRCLPWAMNKPCIVCQENCPVSPKAIVTDEYFETVPEGDVIIDRSGQDSVIVKGANWKADQFSTGDYSLTISDLPGRYKIVGNTADEIRLASQGLSVFIPSGRKARIQVHLQRPYMVIDNCNGCGICEHECPVSGIPAIAVTAEGETRNKNHAILLKRLPKS